MIEKDRELERINSMCKNTMMQTLGMECIDFGDNWVKIRMPVNHNTQQTLGRLHGGASAALIESVGSIGSAVFLDTDKEIPLGLEINANHISGVESGFVVATGKLLHRGKRTHVWQVEIHHESSSKLVCTGRITLLIVPRQQ